MNVPYIPDRQEKIIKKEVKGFVSKFRDFAVKGNAVDLAVGIVIGTAFGKIVSSLVADVITPVLELLIGGVSFSSLVITLTRPLSGADATPITINYGVFLQTMFDFVVIAFVLFLVIQAMHSAKKRFEKEQAEAPKAEKPADIQLLEEIRDALKEKHIG